MSGWRIARIGGVDVRVDPSFLVIVLLLASNIYVGLQDPFRFPQLARQALYSLSLLSAFLFFLSILLHELAHAGMSRALKIHVAGIVLYMFGGATYTAAEEQCRKALASAQCAIRRPTDSALAARSLSQLPLLATARLMT